MQTRPEALPNLNRPFSLFWAAAPTLRCGPFFITLLFLSGPGVRVLPAHLSLTPSTRAGSGMDARA